MGDHTIGTGNLDRAFRLQATRPVSAGAGDATPQAPRDTAALGSPAPPSPSPAPPRRAAAGPPPTQDPPLRATLYRPRVDGSFSRLQKYTPALPDQKPLGLPGTADWVFTAVGPQGPVLVRADARGDMLFSTPLDIDRDRHSLSCGADGSRIYALDKSAALVFDAATGQLIRREPLPAGVHNRDLVPKEDGEVLLAVGQELKRYDRDLHLLGSIPLAFSPGAALALDGGRTLLDDAVYGRNVTLLGPGGEVVLQRGDDSTRVSNPQVRDDGSVWIAESRDSGRAPGESRQAVTRYEATTGITRTFATSDDTRYVFPRPDGSFVALEEPLAIESSLAVYDRDGKMVRRFKPDVQGHGEKTVVSSDGHIAYMLVTPYERDAKPPRTQVLYRFDLDRPASPTEDGLGWIAQKVGFSAGGARVCVGDEGAGAFFPVLLDDGRLLVLRRNGIDLADGQGRPLQHFADRSALDAALGPVRPVSSPETWSKRPAATLDEHLQDWERRTHWLDLKGFLSESAARKTKDGTDSIPSSLAGDAAHAEMGLSEGDVQRHLVESLGAKAFSKPLGRDEERVVSFPSQDGSQVVVSRFDLAIDTPHAGGQPGEYDRIHYCLDDELQETFSMVLPVQVGDRHFALAASSEGRVSWLEAWRSDRDKNVSYGVMHQPWYDVGAPVARLFAGNDRVYALGEDGSVLAFQPPMRPGEVMVGQDVHADDGVKVAKAEDKRVVVSDTEVRIGGIAIKRRT